MTQMAGLTVLTLMVSLLAQVTGSAPQPEVVSRSWELTFTHEKPRPIALRTSGTTHQWYWYMPYKVVNHTGEERMFLPEVTVATDTGDIILANHDIPSRLFEQIKGQLNNSLLESPIKVIGPLLQGEDHARESVIIWADPGPQVDRINLFIAGLSGETAAVPHPETGEPVHFRKTLQVSYATPGSYPRPQQQPILPRGQRWVMR